MKVHVGADVNSGTVHTVSVTPASTPDIGEMPNLLREDDCAVFADAAYVNKGIKQAAREAGFPGAWRSKPNRNADWVEGRSGAIERCPRFEVVSSMCFG